MNPDQFAKDERGGIQRVGLFVGMVIGGSVQLAVRIGPDAEFVVFGVTVRFDDVASMAAGFD